MNGDVSPVLLVRPDELRRAGRLLLGVGEHIEGLAKEAAIVTHTRLKETGEAGANALAPVAA